MRINIKPLAFLTGCIFLTGPGLADAQSKDPVPPSIVTPDKMGPIAAIGIFKGKPFAPDARMKKILTEALEVANATSRTLFMSP
ncbi:MAG: hypothetical protein LJE58_02990 [Thiogranum sp.]|jgi:hypothetical protein|nr:hypothetical protein [Thiogranum sp.]